MTQENPFLETQQTFNSLSKEVYLILHADNYPNNVSDFEKWVKTSDDAIICLINKHKDSQLILVDIKNELLKLKAIVENCANFANIELEKRKNAIS